MMEVGYRYQELYWAIKDSNWAYADHQLHEMEETLERNQLILLTVEVVWLEHGGVVLEVLSEVTVVDGQERHRSIEVFLLLME